MLEKLVLNILEIHVFFLVFIKFNNKKQTVKVMVTNIKIFNI